MPRQLVTIQELAKIAGTSEWTIRRALAHGLKSYPGIGNQKLVCRAEWDAWRNPSKVDAAVAKAVVRADPDALASMRARLPELMAMAETDYRTAREAANGSSASVANAARTYATYAEAARRLEKELPEILYRRNRYVDAVEIGATLGRAAAIVGSELDQVGQAIAEKCEGQDARAIRGVIDDAVAGARLRLTEALERLTATQEVKA